MLALVALRQPRGERGASTIGIAGRFQLGGEVIGLLRLSSLQCRDCELHPLGERLRALDRGTAPAVEERRRQYERFANLAVGSGERARPTELPTCETRGKRGAVQRECRRARGRPARWLLTAARSRRADNAIGQCRATRRASTSRGSSPCAPAAPRSSSTTRSQTPRGFRRGGRPRTTPRPSAVPRSGCATPRG